jgi:RNA polymerase sigma factor (sigma-70 family)
VQTDGVLIERSVRGRPDAFVEVVRRHEVAVHGFLARRGGREAAGDLLGEVWLRAFAARGGYDPGRADALPWLYGIARNVLREHWRAGRDLADPVAEVPDDPWDAVVERIDSGASARTLAAAVRALPPDERDVLLLVAWEELTPTEAAAVLGIPAGTARSRLHRARTALRAVLSRDDREEAGAWKVN